jgi:small ligand-binding sensory domain FIST
MRWLSVSSDADDLKGQLNEIWEAVYQIKEPPDVALVFYVAAEPEWYESLVKVLQYRFKWTVFAGCCAIVAASTTQELYKRKGVVVLFGWLPGVVVESRVVRNIYELPTEDEGPDPWLGVFGATPQLQMLFTVAHHPIINDDPNLARHTFRGLDMAYPNSIRAGVCGDGRYVFAGNESLREGLVCLSFRGALKAVAHGSDPWIKMGVPGVITSLTKYGDIATIDDQPAYEFFRNQVSDQSVLDFEWPDIFLGIGHDWRMTQTQYEKRSINNLSRKDGIVSIDEARVGQQVQIFYYSAHEGKRFNTPEGTRAIIVFTRYNDESFRRAALPFGGVQGLAAITNDEGFTSYEWRSRIGLYIRPLVP